MISFIIEYYRTQWPDLFGTMLLATLGVWLASRVSTLGVLGTALGTWVLSAVVHWLRFRAILQDPRIHITGSVLATSVEWAGVGVVATAATILLLRRFRLALWLQSTISIAVGVTFVPLSSAALVMASCATGGECL